MKKGLRGPNGEGEGGGVNSSARAATAPRGAWLMRDRREWLGKAEDLSGRAVGFFRNWFQEVGRSVQFLLSKPVRSPRGNSNCRNLYAGIWIAL